MKTEIKSSYQTGFNKGLGFGFVLLVIGSLLLAFNIGAIPIVLKDVVFSWPSLLIFIGLVNLFKKHWFSGFMFIVVGKFFLLPRIIEIYPNLFPGLNGDFAQIYWPMLFIVAGIIILTRKLFFPKWTSPYYKEFMNKKYVLENRRYNCSEKRNYNGDGISKNSIFGGGEHIVLDPEFKGGELNAVFGGLILDLRRTNLPEGETFLDINAVFGGITLIIPSDWLIETRIDAVFGGFQDSRIPKEPQNTSRRLVITGSCVFGGGEIRN